MRRSLRFFISCSSSSVIVVRVLFPEQEVVARHAAQNHALQPVEIVEAILRGFADRGQERLAWIRLRAFRTPGASATVAAGQERSLCGPFASVPSHTRQ